MTQYFSGTLSILWVFKAARFRSWLLLFSGKEATNLVNPETELFSISRRHRHRNLFRYTHENKSSPRRVTGKWLLKNWELTTKLKIKPGSIHRLKPLKEAQLRWTRPQTKHSKTRTHVFKILNTTNTICGEKCASLCVQVSFWTNIKILWITRAWQHISPEVNVTGLSAIHLKEFMGLIICYEWRGWECLEWVSRRWRHWLWTWRVTMIGKGRLNLTCFVY
jgi:hypothetical protein